MKFGQFIKMYWMFAWRMAVITPFLGDIMLPFLWLYWGALIPIFILVFFFNTKLLIFPLFQILRFRSPFVRISPYGWSILDLFKKGGRGPYNAVAAQGKPLAVQVIQSASANGTMTGYEPKELASLTIPTGAHIVGSPGKGLTNATGMSQQNITLGQKGEVNFSKALAKSGLIDNFITLWSVRMPDAKALIPSSKYDTDIDSIVITNDTMYLVDLKNYASGDVIYNALGGHVYCRDVATGHNVGDPKKMSNNMKMANEIMKSHFPRLKVKTVVVFMPTDKGEGQLNRVYWPGNIPAMNLSTFLTMLNKEKPGVGSHRAEAAKQRLATLVA